MHVPYIFTVYHFMSLLLSSEPWAVKLCDSLFGLLCLCVWTPTLCFCVYGSSVCVRLHVQQVEGLLLCSAVTWAPFPPQALFLRMDACILVCAASQQWQKHPPSLLPAPVALFLSIHILLFAGRPGFLCDRDWWGLEFMFCHTHLVLHL